MTENITEKIITDSIRDILNEHKGFMKLSQLPPLLPLYVTRELGLRRNATATMIRKVLEPVVKDSFIFRKKGVSIYILNPVDPYELVLSVLSSQKPIGPKMTARNLPFTKKELSTMVNELSDSGRLKVIVNENLEPRLLLASPSRKVPGTPTPPTPPEKYTVEEMRRAFDDLDHGRIFVRICDLRRKLGWPRDVFDQMLRNLRDKEIIQLHAGDASLMTVDEVNDCFIDENNFRMGSVTWHVK